MDPVYRHHTTQALYLAYLYVEDEDAADHPSYLDFELLRRSPSGLMDLEYLWSLKRQALSNSDFLTLASKTRSFLGACCKDLIMLPRSFDDDNDDDNDNALSENPSVLKAQFIHRSVYDYLRTTNRIRSLSQKVPPCFKDGTVFHLLNMAKMKLYPNIESPLRSKFFLSQAAFSLDRHWPGLDLNFVGEMQISQSLHQCLSVSSIAAAYIAFESYDASEPSPVLSWTVSPPFPTPIFCEHRRHRGLHCDGTQIVNTAPSSARCGFERGRL